MAWKVGRAASRIEAGDRIDVILLWPGPPCEIGVGLLVLDGVRGLVGRKLDDLDLAGSMPYSCRIP
jgi:hypothetical protein